MLNIAIATVKAFVSPEMLCLVIYHLLSRNSVMVKVRVFWLNGNIEEMDITVPPG